MENLFYDTFFAAKKYPKSSAPVLVAEDFSGFWTNSHKNLLWKYCNLY
ncbi:hypothetical protein Dip510_000354 [Elusimicrobium posterum]